MAEEGEGEAVLDQAPEEVAQEVAEAVEEQVAEGGPEIAVE